MKKVTLLTQAKDAQGMLSKLRSIGLLHPEHQKAPEATVIAGMLQDLSILQQAITILSEYEVTKETVTQAVDWRSVSRHIVEQRKHKEQLQDYYRQLSAQYELWQAWGDFDPAQIEILAQQGIFCRFYQIPVKEIKKINAAGVLKKISAQKGWVNYVLISRQKQEELGFKELALPKMGLAQIEERMRHDSELVRRIDDNLRSRRKHLSSLVEAKGALEKEIEFYRTLSGMGASGEISYVVGYIPYDQTPQVISLAKQEKCALLITDPAAEDAVPTMIRNPRWIALINPVLRMLEIIPGYRELDISLSFLVFLSIFFGILIGDAGYGLTYIGITLFLQRKLRKRIKDHSVFVLFYCLSSCAVIWGALTGTFFGQAWVLASGYRPLIPALNDPKTMQAFCFFLGALHLSIAHTWKILLHFPQVFVLADLGWIFILWAAFFLANALILGAAFPFFGQWLIIAGIVLVILFSSPQRNILKSIASGLGVLALSLMNNFTDVVSYVRLFAVGLAGVAIADAFNAMAAMVGHANLAATVAGAAIAVIGHMLGMALGPVSVLVHGVRLNVLEFSGHVNVSWSGTKYTPLKA